MTLLGLAVTEYAGGDRGHGDAVRAKAQTACDEAEKRFRQAEARGYAVTGLMRENFRNLKDRIEIAGRNDR